MRHREIADDLRRRIDAGEWPTGEVLPRMEDLGEAYGAARGTVAEAVRQLETEGLVLSVKRKGTVVLEHRVRRRVPRSNKVYRRRPRQGGYSFGATAPGETWVHHIPPTYAEAPITERAAELLGVEPGIEIFRRRRVTSPPGEPPFALIDSWILPEVVQAAPGVREQGVAGQYLDHIEKVAGHGPLRWQEITRCRMPSEEEASLLRIPMRLPVQEACRVAISDKTGEPVDVTINVIPADRIETIVDIERDASAQWVQVLSPPGGPHSYKEA